MIKKIKPVVSSAFLWIFIDQLSKYLVRHYDGFYICNKGIAFGLNIPDIIFLPIWMGILGATVLYFFRSGSEAKNNKDYWLLITSYGLLISGALSNLIDRMVFGCIIDFIDLKIWPVFNLADTFIVIGAILIVVKNLKQKTQNKN